MVYVAEGRLELKIPSESFYIWNRKCVCNQFQCAPTIVTADYCKLHSGVSKSTLIFRKWRRSVLPKSMYDPLFFRLCSFPVWEYVTFSGFAVRLTWSYQEPPGFEFVVRENLSRGFVFPWQKNLKSDWRPGDTKVRTILRIRKMLDIQRYYFDDIKLWRRMCEGGDISGEENVCAVFRRQYSFRPSGMF